MRGQDLGDPPGGSFNCQKLPQSSIDIYGEKSFLQIQVRTRCQVNEVIMYKTVQ